MRDEVEKGIGKVAAAGLQGRRAEARGVPRGETGRPGSPSLPSCGGGISLTSLRVSQLSDQADGEAAEAPHAGVKTSPFGGKSP